MTQEEHYAEAERLLEATTPGEIAKAAPLGDVRDYVAENLARAQVHATLSLYMPPVDFDFGDVMAPDLGGGE